MSYCRWSSDDHQCDVYVWADCAGGWRTELAGRRRVFKQPLPPPIDLPVGEPHTPERTAWAAAHVERMSIVSALCDDEDAFDWLDLPTPPGGHTYWHHTAADTADNLERLQGLGYNVPQHAIDSLRVEAAEAERTTT